ncbi:MAG: hypothetical protein ACOCTG_02615, partial [Bacteroidota bacterium]
MATKRNPEERSARSGAARATSVVQPSGNETFDPEASAATDHERVTAETITPEEARSRLQQAAAEYYENLSEAAEKLSRQTTEVYDVGANYIRANLGPTLALAAGIG